MYSTSTCGRAVPVLYSCGQCSPWDLDLGSRGGAGAHLGSPCPLGSLPAVVEVVLVGHGHQLGLREAESVSGREDDTRYWLTMHHE